MRHAAVAVVLVDADVGEARIDPAARSGGERQTVHDLDGRTQDVSGEEPGVRLSPEHVLDLRDDVEQSTLASR